MDTPNNGAPDSLNDCSSEECRQMLEWSPSAVLQIDRQHQLNSLKQVEGAEHRAPSPLDASENETDFLLSRTLNQLSIQERNHILHDLHGVAEMEVETSDLLEERLKFLDTELEIIQDKPAYNNAKSISYNFVRNAKFRLQFLRADQYNARDAAKRMVAFFETKKKIFGEAKLAQDITLRDFQEEELEYFKQCCIQLYPPGDSTGRPIIFLTISLCLEVPKDTRLRIMWYVMQSVAVNDETQRKGAIVVLDAIASRNGSVQHGPAKLIQLTQSMPLRLSGIHICYDELDLHPVLRDHFSILDLNQLVRLRFHYGSRLECMFSLGTFGIPKEAFPIDSEGYRNPSIMHQWLRLKKESEAAAPATSLIVAPNQFDVLFGRSKRALESPGNQYFRNALSSHSHKYEKGTRFQKMVITEMILKEVKDRGGRFLIHGEFGWTEVDDTTARKKISHDFRNIRQSLSDAVERAKDRKRGNRDVLDASDTSDEQDHTNSPSTTKRAK